jgi:hypothetical protein
MNQLKRHKGAFTAATVLLVLTACAPRITRVEPAEGSPGTTVSLGMKYLVGWPRVDIAGHSIEWGELRLLSAAPDKHAVRGEDLVWIEDKILQFRIPDIKPGDYVLTVFDDKGPPGQPLYSALETAAYAAFPPVWPFVFRSNQAQAQLRVLPQDASQSSAR